ncbi:hypothetical protein JST97_29520 [bacterium]|nr:hypothetical protein [bacterium]
MSKKPVHTDVLVICALPDELDALRKVASGGEGSWTKYIDSSGFPYYWKELPHADAKSTYSVAAAQASSMGGDSTANAATRLCMELKPRCLAMCGICAGDKSSVRLGDVVCADRVYRFDYGKLIADEKGETFLHDITTYNLKPSWKQAAENYGTHWAQGLQKMRPVPLEDQLNWFLLQTAKDNLSVEQLYASRGRSKRCPDWNLVLEKLLKNRWIKRDLSSVTKSGLAAGLRMLTQSPEGYKKQDLPVKVAVGAMGTSNNVREDRELFSRLKRAGVRKTIAVEMESCAIGLVAANENIEYQIAAKAVSDYGDPEKDDAFREFSCRSSATFLLDFLTHNLPPLDHRNTFFLTPIQYSDQLESSGAVYLKGNLLGRDLLLQDLTTLEKANWLTIAVGPGGIGKTRLLLGSCSSSDEIKTLFVPAGVHFNEKYLNELVPGKKYRIIIDDAHRRGDLSNILSHLRQEQVASVVAIIRPGFENAIENSLPQGLNHSRMKVGRLRRDYLDQILINPPFNLKIESLRAEILSIAEGNPQLAALAAQRINLNHSIQVGRRLELVESFCKGFDSWAASSSSTARRLLLGAVAAARGCTKEDLTMLAEASEIGLADLCQARSDALDAGILHEQAGGLLQFKPDIISDGYLSYCFLGDREGAIFPYSWFYNKFKLNRRDRLLEALGEAISASELKENNKARVVIEDFSILYAHSAREALGYFKRFASAFPDYSVIFFERAFADIRKETHPELKDELLSMLYLGMATVKFRDLQAAWRPLLKIGEEAFLSGSTKTIKEFLDDINDFLKHCPLPETALAVHTMEQIRRFIAEDSLAYWAGNQNKEACAEVVSAVSREVLRVTTHFTRQAASSSQAFRFGTYSVQAIPGVTEISLKIGADLYSQTFLSLSTKSQRTQVDWLNSMYADLQQHQNNEIGAIFNGILTQVIEPFLQSSWKSFSLSLQAKVTRVFLRHRPSLVGGLVTPELRKFLLLVCDETLSEQKRPTGGVDYTELVAPLVDELGADSNPIQALSVWSKEIDSHVACGGDFRGFWPMSQVIASLLEIKPFLIDDFFARLHDSLSTLAPCATLALRKLTDETQKTKILVSLANAAEVRLRLLAAEGLAGMKVTGLKDLWSRLALDSCASVAEALYLSLPTQLDRECLEIIDLILGATTDNSLIETIVTDLTLDPNQRFGKKVSLEDTAWYDRTILWTATKDIREQRLAEIVNRRLLIPWVWARLEAQKSGLLTDSLYPFPRELRQPLRELPRNAEWHQALARAAKWCEEASLTKDWSLAGSARWLLISLGVDSTEFNELLEGWATQGPELFDLALDLVAESHWSEHFVERAANLLSINPSPSVEDHLINAPYPRSFINSEEPYYRKVGEKFKSWENHPNLRIRKVGQKAVDFYTKLADQAAERWDEEHNY